MSTTHNYTASGHYAAKLTVTGTNGVSTVVVRTIHVLTVSTILTVVKNPDSFTEATIGEPDYLDPAVDYETAGGEVLNSVYENLIWYDGSSASNLKPVLAKEVPTIANGLVSADGLNYTFNLRTDVTFHDGTVMNADDVVYSVRRVLQIHDPSGPGWMIDQIFTDYIGFSVGATVADWGTSAPWLLSAVGSSDPAYVLTELDVKNASEAAILKVNDTAVTFRLTHPYPGFMKIAAYTVMNIVSKDFVEAHGGITPGEHNDYMDSHTCGTGPYKLVVWEVGAKVHMTRFDDYWGSAPDIKDIYIVKANDVNTRILMLQAGDADCIYLPIKYESTFTGKTDYRIVKGLPSFDLTFMAFNFNIDATTANSQYGGTITVDFFHDIHMRKAFTHLLNYTQYIANVAMGNAKQPNGVIPEGMFGYDPDIPKYDYNLTAAAEEFQLASGTWWDDGFTIPLFYNAGNLGRQTACEMIKLSLESIPSVGQMTATVNALDWPTFLDQVYNTNGYMPVYAIGWGPDYADPDDYANPMLASTGTYPYFTGYANATIDALVMEAASELDETTRADLYSQMAQLVYEDCPYIWLTQPNNFHIERAWVQGYYYNPMFAGLYFPSYSK
jgi:peptide/nickel transport system substrate-binding protein